MYVELHARSAFSFLKGASSPEELAAACAALGIPAMALADRDGVYGSPRFHFAAKKAGIRAHVGAEVTCADGGIYTLLVKNRAGYRNLCRLITRMKLRAKKYEGAATQEEIAEHAEGLVCLTGGLEACRQSFERLIAAFGRENVYAEIQRHMIREEEARNQAIVELARSLKLPLLATNGVCHAAPAEREIFDVLTCIGNKVKLETAGRLLAANAERHLKPGAAMARLFTDLPEAIANTAELSARLEFELTDLGYEFPKYPVPDGETMDSFLRKRAIEGARDRYRPFHERARLQIERELALIEKLKLAGYFLIVWDLVEFCRNQGILAQGRGSAANSAVCFSLGITAVDPVGMDLLFERFLSEERGEWPDIDLDLPSGDKRERVIQYVYERYGRLGAAMTANVITYRGRSAAREVGKVLGFDEESVARLSSLVRTWEWKDPKDTPERQFRIAGFDLDDQRIRKFLELYIGVQNLPRHLGQHSGGMVICQGQLDSIVPLEPATMPGRVVVQWDKDDCADLGLIKVDLLGLGMIAVLEESLIHIRDSYGEDVDLAHLPPDDAATYDALQRADTIGMFQVESRAQQAALPRNMPVKFYDLVVQVGLIRPGPIVGRLVHPYLKRRAGREPADCFHPSLEPVLRRTLGVPIFQEQLLRMAMIVSGFTGGEAEELRRAFSHKRSEAKMREIEVRLRAGMESRGIAGDAQDRIALAITSFALYGFPESHAASFALLAYASAYLKTHYLGAFTCALLNNWPMGFYHPSTIVKDAQRHGLRVLPVDAARSEWLCTLEPHVAQASSQAKACALSLDILSELGNEIRGAVLQDCAGPPGPAWRDVDVPRRRGRLPHVSETNQQMSKLQSQAKACATVRCKPLTWHRLQPVEHALRLGFRYVRGMRQETGEAIARARVSGAFTSIDDLVRRVPELRKDEMTTLAGIGALNSLQALDRRGALWESARAIQPVGPLLRHLEETEAISPLARMTPEERLRADYHGTGVTVGRHPMAFRREEMNALGVTRAADLHAMRNGRFVRVAGVVIVRQRPGTAKGFVFLSLEDETGIANVIVTPDTFEANRADLVNAPFLFIEGTLQNVDNVTSVKAARIAPLAAVMEENLSHDFR